VEAGASEARLTKLENLSFQSESCPGRSTFSPLMNPYSILGLH
jgi:hypothetical protein